MPYSQVKVYSDGSHYIGIPYIPDPRAKNRRPRHEEIIEVREPIEEELPAALNTENNTVEEQNPDDVQENSAPPAVRQMTHKELFDELYQETFDMKKRERWAYIVKQMLPYFEDGSSCRAFVEQNFERKHRNMICRRTRLWRKINHQRFNYFVTLTYSDDKMTEEQFAKKLMNTLSHFSCRKGWLYIGAWERGGETNRLHFHGLFYIPEGTLSGEMEILRDFDTRKRRMQTVQQNTFFAKRFGRNEFRPINHVSEMPQAVQYLVKYIEKSGGKLIYSRGLYQYFVTDIMDEDIVCPYGLEDRKILLFDSFGCWVEGEYIGQVSPEVIALLPKVT